MQKMSELAASWYFETALDCFWLGISSEDELFDRLSFLAEVSDDLNIQSRIKNMFEGLEESSRWEDASEGLAEEPKLQSQGENNGGIREPMLDILHLIVHGKSGISTWEFHEYDFDFFPSVPHGHNINTREKLDAYLGYVYDKTRQVSRIRRSIIVFLWNDAKFRVLARSSIRWFMATHPTFNWRVSHPLRIPRKRKV